MEARHYQRGALGHRCRSNGDPAPQSPAGSEAPGKAAQRWVTRLVLRQEPRACSSALLRSSLNLLMESAAVAWTRSPAAVPAAGQVNGQMQWEVGSEVPQVTVTRRQACLGLCILRWGGQLSQGL